MVGPTVRFATPLPALYALARQSLPAPKHGADVDEMDAPHDADRMVPHIFGGKHDTI